MNIHIQPTAVHQPESKGNPENYSRIDDNYSNLDQVEYAVKIPVLR